MRKISLWAKAHSYQARAYIVFIKIILILLAIFTGRLLHDEGISLSPLMAISSGVLLIAVALVYPKKIASRFSGKQTYIFRKSCDFTLAFTTFIFISVLANGNRLMIESTNPSAAFASSINKIAPPTAEEILASLKYRDKNSLTRHEKRILKKEFSKQLKIYAKSKVTGDRGGEKAALIILTIIGAIGLSLLLASLACSVACGGADGLAILIIVVGLTAIIWGTVVLIKRIKKIHKKSETDKPATAVSPSS